MTLNVLHLSDIHFRNKSDQIVARTSEIASATFALARSASKNIIVVSGDIAHGGNAVEYTVAEEFLSELRSLLARETGSAVDVLVSPGNHDCILKPPSLLRERTIQTIIENPQDALDEEMLGVCTGVQRSFFEFRNRIETLKPVFEHPLWNEYKFEIDGNVVRASMLNVSWMSRLQEQQGGLVFPVKAFENLLGERADLRLAVMHHPFNWYQQRDYQHLRRTLRTYSSVVLTGHEHLPNTGAYIDDMTGASLFFEAPALQPPVGDGIPGFFCHLFDFNTKTVKSTLFTLDTAGIHEGESPSIHAFQLLVEKKGQSLELSEGFIERLRDAGANLTHSDKEDVAIDDIFVYPDMQEQVNDPKKLRPISAESLISGIGNGEKLLITGEEKSGKSTLLLQYYKVLRSDGRVPVYLDVSGISFKTRTDAEKRVTQAIETQYVHPEAVLRTPKEKLILLLDNVDRIKAGPSFLAHLLQYADNQFASLVCTSDRQFEYSGLLSKEAAEALSALKNYELLRFGQKLRHRLIKKWCALSDIATKTDLDQRVYDSESLINSIIGKKLVPELPIYILILLQSSEQHRHGEIQNGGYGHYYQYLITKSLGEVGVKPLELNEYYNYLAQLSWQMLYSKQRELDYQNLSEFNCAFSERFTTVDLESRLALLLRARILCKQGDCYAFSYPYIFYYFAGKYLSANLSNPEIRAWVEQACGKLHIRENSDTILFLTHHTDESWVIEQIAAVLNDCFPDHKPMELNGDTDAIDALVESASQLVIEMGSVEENQDRFREIGDEVSSMQDEEPELDPKASGELAFMAQWNLLMKTADILGQILKNYYGSLEKSQKSAYLIEVFNGPLRAVRGVLEDVAGDTDGLITQMEHTLDVGDKKPPRDEWRRELKKVAFNILGMMGFATIAATGSYVASDKLREDIRSVVNNNPTVAFRLIEMATRLLRPGSPPLQDVKRLADELKDKPYAFGILQSLGFQHMYLYHTSASDMQALCSYLKLTLSATKTVLTTHKEVRLLPK
ncbi:metallophosphoesterase family protein [Ralstonia solanacearum]|uniref:metallophosphoesterase family protein n=1 Tax=Ralstonia solanacearum TaxID=305 RepID=UPI0018D18E79|nr:metallophosphoesterase [Ralstonia solanacearum]